MPPVNDNLASAVVISGVSGNVGPYTIDDATNESGEPNPSAAFSSQTIWFKWIAPSSGTTNFTTDGSIDTGSSGELDTVLAIYTGTNFADFVELTSDDDHSGHVTSTVTFAAVAGTTYWIQAGTYSGSAVGHIVLGWIILISPSNDNFANATVLTSPNYSERVNLELATLEPGEPQGYRISGTQYGSIWYKYTPPSDKYVLFWVPGYWITLWIGSSLATLVNPPDDYNRDDQSINESGWFHLEAGTTYYIQVATNLSSGNPTSTLTFTDGLVTPSLEKVESPTLPYKVYGNPLNPVIAVRAADFIAPARAGLSLVSDGSSSCGQVVRETQQVPYVGFVSNPLVVDQKTMFLSAQDTIVIPFSALPWPVSVPSGVTFVSVFVRYKMTFTGDDTHPMSEGIYTIGLANGIGSMFGASTNPSISNEYDQPKKLPFWNLHDTFPNESFGTIIHSGLDLKIRAFSCDTNDAVWEIDQIIIVPHDYSIDPTMDPLDDIAFTDGTPITRSRVNRVSELVDTEEWDIATGAGEMTDRQKKSGYSSAEATTYDIGSFNRATPSYAFIRGVGPIYVPDNNNFIHDDFNRTVVNAWGNIKAYNWWTEFAGSTFYNVVPGDATINRATTAGSSSYFDTWHYSTIGLLHASLGTPQNGQANPQRLKDSSSANGEQIDAVVGWDGPAFSGTTYVACVGWHQSSGPAGTDTNFAGLAIIAESGSLYACIVQGNISGTPPILSGTPTPWRELSSRVAISGSQPLTVKVERKRQHIIATVEGHVLEADISLILYGGGFPYPNRWWWDYPYSDPAPATSSYIIGLPPEPFENWIPGIGLRFTGAIVHCYDFKLSLKSYGSAPTSGGFAIERQDGTGGHAEITLPYGVIHILYAGINYFTSGPSWRTRQWINPGAAEMARMAMSDWIFTEYTLPVGTTVSPSIFWFFKDGTWHNQNIDTTHSLYIFRNGAWRQNGVDTAHQLKGQLDGTWQT